MNPAGGSGRELKSRKRDADRPRSSISMVDCRWPVYALSEGVVQTKLKLAEPSVVVSTYSREHLQSFRGPAGCHPEPSRAGPGSLRVRDCHRRQQPEVLSESHRAGRTTCTPLEDGDRTRNRSDEPRAEESSKSWQMALTGPLPDEGAVCR
jgi:hypothetical protein